MKCVSIIIPIFNEERFLREVIESVLTFECQVEKEIILVDDASTDQSYRILENYSSHPAITILRRTKQGGKGLAVREGMALATGDIILIQDADLEYQPEDIPQLIAPILSRQAQVVFGSRFTKDAQWLNWSQKNANRLITWISNRLTGYNLSDIETCYKAIDRTLVNKMNLRSKRFEIEVEITAYLAKMKTPIIEVPILYKSRNWTHGKKISWLDGISAIYYLFIFNLFTTKKRAFRQ